MCYKNLYILVIDEMEDGNKKDKGILDDFKFFSLGDWVDGILLIKIENIRVIVDLKRKTTC